LVSGVDELKLTLEGRFLIIFVPKWFSFVLSFSIVDKGSDEVDIAFANAKVVIQLFK
jgi:hypothetical protein